jgi:TolB-like protein/Flp pilus assembly protein TadD
MSGNVTNDPKLEIGHVLFMDIVGYSKLLIGEQSDLVCQLKEVVIRSEQFRCAEEQNRLVTLPTGDGIALVFRHDAEAPVQCALELTEALKSHPQLQLRMGIHSGPVNVITDVSNRANVAGAGINMAQRVMDCGDARHILLSKRTAEDLESYARWRPYLHDLGECEVKHGVRISLVNFCADNFGNPIIPEKLRLAKYQEAAATRQKRKRFLFVSAILAGGVLVAGYWIARNQLEQKGASRSATIPEKSIAVLPFENLSRDPDNSYFADGIQDEILTRLSKISDLKVISRTSTQLYKSAPENLPEIGRQLGVAHVLEGSVQKSGDAVRVNVQLIRAANDSHLWAQTFDRKLTDIFSVESEVAKAIADELRLHLTGREEQIITARPTDNPEAYDAYLRGAAYALRAGNTPANALGAQKYLREAVKLDPKMAVGWALLATVDAIGYINHNLQPTVALCEEAREAAETALTLQPNLGEALMAKGHYHYSCLKDYDTAVQCFEQARQFLPNDSLIPQSLAYIARRRGQWDRSESFFNQAERFDPRNVSLLTQHAFSYICLRRFPEALRKLDQILDITPDDIDTLGEKAGIAQAEGDLPRASALLSSLQPAVGDIALLEAQIYQAILERRPAEIIPRLEKTLAKPDPTLGYYNGELRFWLGWAQGVAGDHAAALESWRQARSELEPFLKEQPENWALIGDLALTNMALGDKVAALSLSERAILGNPVEKDAVVGPASIEILARVAAQINEPDQAIAALSKLISTPYEGPLALNLPLTPALLRLDPMFDPLRGDPRFEKIVATLAPKD